jgi:hypothetical protein
VAAAEAAIGTLTAPITMDRLSGVLGWPLARLMAALAGLEDALEHSGSRVATDGHHLLGLRPRHGILTDDQREVLHRGCAAGTSFSEAAVWSASRTTVLRRHENDSGGDLRDVAAGSSWPNGSCGLKWPHRGGSRWTHSGDDSVGQGGLIWPH